MFKGENIMEKILLLGYEFITVIIPALFAIGVHYLIYKRKNIKVKRWHFMYILIFAVYIFGVFHFTGAGTIFDIKLYGIEFKNSQLNFMPFSDKDIDFIAYLLNVILFIPLGFLIPFIWIDFSSFKKIMIFGTALSLVIEMSQLFNNRRTDIDDLILNTAGAIIGFILYRLYLIIFKKPITSSDTLKYESIIYVSVMFAGHFLLFNEFGMAKRLFNF